VNEEEACFPFGVSRLFSGASRTHSGFMEPASSSDEFTAE
jgi:hypothetical protein